MKSRKRKSGRSRRKDSGGLADIIKKLNEQNEIKIEFSDNYDSRDFWVVHFTQQFEHCDTCFESKISKRKKDVR